MADKEKTVIDLKNHDFGCILTAAIRYSLGRTTYMPGLVTDFIRPILPYLDDTTVFCMKRDITEHGAFGKKAYGHDCDFRTWMDFLDDVEMEVRKRGIK